jgi:hypothetical protein
VPIDSDLKEIKKVPKIGRNPGHDNCIEDIRKVKVKLSSQSVSHHVVSFKAIKQHGSDWLSFDYSARKRSQSRRMSEYIFPKRNGNRSISHEIRTDGDERASNFSNLTSDPQNGMKFEWIN